MAKRIITGNAKLFIQYECCATTWPKLEEELVTEFGKAINSALVHDQLKSRKKKSNETNMEYFYEMVAIALNISHV